MRLKVRSRRGVPQVRASRSNTRCLKLRRRGHFREGEYYGPGREGRVAGSISPAAYGDAGDPHERAKAMRRAWEEFFVSGTVLPWVRPAIAESWRRSRELGISPTLHTRPLDERGLERLLHSDVRRLLIRASADVLDRMVDITEGSSLSFTL